MPYDMRVDFTLQLSSSSKQREPQEKEHIMPKMTKSQIAAAVAEKTGIAKKQANEVMDVLASLAYKEAKNTFTIPGLGKLVLVQRAAREMVMRFGPKAGKTVKVPAKKVVKFRIAKAAKEAILGKKK